jgi:hypothetical protein
MKKRCMYCIVAVAILAAAASAYADNWSWFYSLTNNVSVSFAPVNGNTYTWKFRNDGYDTIHYMEFSYSYIDANTGLYKTDTDVLPGSLRPGQVFGGWAAFTAVSRTQPTIRITKIDRH